ncbi:hypothetical protein ABKN59_002114 [Abortiporus biennis]
MSNPSDWPPPPPDNETDEERQHRIELARLAKKRSDEIDNAIELERQEKQSQKRHPPSKVLLLGQAQSEAEAWRAVIYLNLVRSVSIILQALANAAARTSSISRATSPVSRHPLAHDQVRQLRMTLSPLKQVEISLNKILSTEFKTARISGEHDFCTWNDKPGVSVRGGSAWKALADLQSHDNPNRLELENVRYVIEACGEDIVSIWGIPGVRKTLKTEGVVLEDHMTYYLDHASRVTSHDYVPSPQDILRARLETIGVEEHRVIMETGESELADPGQEWLFYDVEGSRSQRAAWVPYFDDANAVLFLCSMANFDQNLPDESGINSFADSFNLWKGICESKLLADAPLVLFLNKTDLLETKLQSGVSFGQYVQDFGQQPNDYETVVQYFKTIFTNLHKKYSPKPRLLHIYTTCAIDSRAMSVVLHHVKQSIFTSALDSTTLI